MASISGTGEVLGVGKMNGATTLMVEIYEGSRQGDTVTFLGGFGTDLSGVKVGDVLRFEGEVNEDGFCVLSRYETVVQDGAVRPPREPSESGEPAPPRGEEFVVESFDPEPKTSLTDETPEADTAEPEIGSGPSSDAEGEEVFRDDQRFVPGSEKFFEGLDLGPGVEVFADKEGPDFWELQAGLEKCYGFNYLYVSNGKLEQAIVADAKRVDWNGRDAVELCFYNPLARPDSGVKQFFVTRVYLDEWNDLTPPEMHLTEEQKEDVGFLHHYLSGLELTSLQIDRERGIRADDVLVRNRDIAFSEGCPVDVFLEFPDVATRTESERTVQVFKRGESESSFRLDEQFFRSRGWRPAKEIRINLHYLDENGEKRSLGAFTVNRSLLRNGVHLEMNDVGFVHLKDNENKVIRSVYVGTQLWEEQQKLREMDLTVKPPKTVSPAESEVVKNETEVPEPPPGYEEYFDGVPSPDEEPPPEEYEEGFEPPVDVWDADSEPVLEGKGGADIQSEERDTEPEMERRDVPEDQEGLSSSRSQAKSQEGVTLSAVAVGALPELLDELRGVRRDLGRIADSFEKLLENVKVTGSEIEGIKDVLIRDSQMRTRIDVVTKIEEMATRLAQHMCQTAKMSGAKVSPEDYVRYYSDAFSAARNLVLKALSGMMPDSDENVLNLSGMGNAQERGSVSEQAVSDVQDEKGKGDDVFVPGKF